GEGGSWGQPSRSACLAPAQPGRSPATIERQSLLFVPLTFFVTVNFTCSLPWMTHSVAVRATRDLPIVIAPLRLALDSTCTMLAGSCGSALPLLTTPCAP